MSQGPAKVCSPNRVISGGTPGIDSRRFETGQWRHWWAAEHAEAGLWSGFEEFVIEGSLLSFTEHAGIDLQGVRAERVWDKFKAHYTRHGRIDMDHFLKDFATWGPILPSKSSRNYCGQRIVDGDTVQIEKTKVRFAGIDAPETDQICLDAAAQSWACGITARDELIKHSGGQSWSCEITGTDRYGRSLGNCFITGEDVSAWMVRSGWALSFVRYSHAYDTDEALETTSRRKIGRV